MRLWRVESENNRIVPPRGYGLQPAQIHVRVIALVFFYRIISEHHIFRGKIRSVMEFDILPEFKRVGSGVVTDFPVFRQISDILGLRADPRQRAVDKRITVSHHALKRIPAAFK